MSCVLWSSQAVGRSFWPIPIYGNVDVGYRMRTKNDEIDRDPGDEWIFNGEIGYSVTPRLLVALKVEALRGKRAQISVLSRAALSSSGSRI